MITQFKIYEVLNQGEPKVGDYVICCEEPHKGYIVFFDEDGTLGSYVDDFLSRNIGKIIEINSEKFYPVKIS